MGRTVSNKASDNQLGYCSQERWGSRPIDIMLIADISEEPNLALRYEHGHTQRMNWCVTKSFIEESTSSVQPVEIFLVCFGSEIVQISHFEVRQELAIVVVPTIMWIEKPIEVCLGMDKLWVCVDEGARS